jgi:hypothetical protein
LEKSERGKVVHIGIRKVMGWLALQSPEHMVRTSTKYPLESL